METVSVVIPTFNRCEYLRRAIVSVLRQTRPPDEIIVVDDGSIDGTGKLVRSFAERLTYVRTANRGPAAARNEGIRRSRGSLVSFLDSDDLWKPSKLQNQMELFARNPALSACHTNFDWIDESGKEFPWDDGEYTQEGMLFMPLLLCKTFILLSSLTVRSECFSRAGLFDESLKTAEDTNFLMKLARFYRFGYVSGKSVLKCVHRDTLSRKAYVSFDNNDTFANLDRIFSVFPQPAKIRRQAYNIRYFHYGYSNFKHDNLVMARRCLIKSVENGNISPRVLAFLLFSFLPRGMFSAIRRNLNIKERNL